MLDNIKVWFYGTRTVKIKRTKNSKGNRGASSTRKEFYRLKDSEIGKAKGFHLFVRKSKRSNWIRVSDAVERFPAKIRSISDKVDFLSTYTAFAVSDFLPSFTSVDYVPETERLKPRPVEVYEKPEEGYFVADEEEIEKVIADTAPKVELPPLPEEPYYSITKKQFYPLVSGIILEQIKDFTPKWSDARINEFVDKLWFSYSEHPHFITSDLFRKNIVLK